MNTQVAKVGHCHHNRLVKTIPTAPYNLNKDSSQITFAMDEGLSRLILIHSKESLTFKFKSTHRLWDIIGIVLPVLHSAFSCDGAKSFAN